MLICVPCGGFERTTETQINLHQLRVLPHPGPLDPDPERVPVVSLCFVHQTMGGVASVPPAREEGRCGMGSERIGGGVG